MQVIKYCIIVFIAFCSSAVCAENNVVAKVNGVPLSAFDLDQEFQDLLPMMGSYHGGVSAERMAQIRKKAFDNLIDKELKYQYAVAKGMTVPKKEIEAELAKIEKKFGTPKDFKKALTESGITKEILKELIKKGLLAAKAKEVEVTSKATLSDAEIKDYYEKNRGAYKRPVGFRASHILIGVEPSATAEEREKGHILAKDVLAKVKAGEDFASLAEQYSTDQTSAVVGGRLGVFHVGMTEPDFERGVLALKVGEVSDVVETLYGYHIIKLTEKIPEAQLTLDDVRAELKKKLEKSKADDLYNKWLEKLKADAKIEIYQAGR